MKTADYLAIGGIFLVLAAGYVFFTRNRGRTPSAFAYDTSYAVGAIRPATLFGSAPRENAAPTTPLSRQSSDCGCTF